MKNEAVQQPKQPRNKQLTTSTSSSSTSTSSSSSIEIPKEIPQENSPVTPHGSIFKQNLVHRLGFFGVLSTILGYTSSSLCPIVGYFSGYTQAVSPYWWRQGYNGGSTIQSLVGGGTLDLAAFENEQARKSGSYSQVLSVGAVMSGLTVGYLMMLGDKAPVFNSKLLHALGRTSAGFNVTGFLNVLRARFHVNATTQESNHQMDKLGHILNEVTGIPLTDITGIINSKVPHVTPEEHNARVGGLDFSLLGSFTGALAAVTAAKYPVFSAVSGVVSGVGFGIGLGRPLIQAGNTDVHRKFDSDKNHHLDQIKNNAMYALLPWAILTGLGFYALGKEGLKPQSHWAKQGIAHGLMKCDNTFALLSVAAAFMFQRQNDYLQRLWNGQDHCGNPSALRAFYSELNRNSVQKEVIHYFETGGGTDRWYSNEAWSCIKEVRQAVRAWEARQDAPAMVNGPAGSRDGSWVKQAERSLEKTRNRENKTYVELVEVTKKIGKTIE